MLKWTLRIAAVAVAIVLLGGAALMEENPSEAPYAWLVRVAAIGIAGFVLILWDRTRIGRR